MANEKAAPKAKKVPALSVVAKRDSFRRCGRKFGSEAVVIPLDELSKDEVKKLTSDKMLVTNEVMADVAGEGDATAEAAPQ